MKSYSDPSEALRDLAECLKVVPSELGKPTAGRVLAEPIMADRDSPAADVSAMDGYAIRLVDLELPQARVNGESQPGQPPLVLEPQTAIRIFTGALVPRGAEAIVMREDTDESSPDLVRWLDRARQVKRGENIRFQGENGKAGDTIVPAGTRLTSASIAAAANFGRLQLVLHRPVRVSIIVTGNELLDADSTPSAWQLRDSNGPTIEVVCSSRPWLQCSVPSRCIDDPGLLKQQLANALTNSDTVILTGGVSKGDCDHVPGVIASLGATTIFHRLPMRPGRPILGAISTAGQLILGLPGNPVSAIVSMTRFGIPLLAKQSGRKNWQPIEQAVSVIGQTESTLPLHWYRLVEMIEPGVARLIDSRGSGDLVALSRSTGFIYQPPHTTGSGPWLYYSW